jgi:hypothetical protein
MSQSFLASLTRISDLDKNPFDVRPLPRSQWHNGDYVLTEAAAPASELYQVELSSGEMVPVDPGDTIIGAFGSREATLEGVGSYTAVTSSRMHMLTAAGLLGRFTSFSIMLPRPMSVIYRGHVVRDGRKLTMRDFALQSEPRTFSVPTILMVGTSMSAGKTVTGRRVCEILSASGFKVIGCKLTGAGRFRDIASFRKFGAREIYDFVDVGLPSTVGPEAEFRTAIRHLLSHIESRKPDFMVAEAGASPLEPYNVAAAMDELGDTIRCTILCASDPYAVVGVRDAFALEPDLVAGRAAQTSAAIELVRKLTGLRALNVIDRRTIPEFRRFLEQKLDIRIADIAS